MATILSNISQNLFGESELIFRMPALLAGILAVPLIYFFSYQCTNSRLGAFLPALLLALSGPHIKWSQLGRGYTLTIFLAVLVMLSVFKLIKNSNNKTWGLLLVASSFGMVLTLPSNIYFVFACSLFFTFMIIYLFAIKFEVSILFKLEVSISPVIFSLSILYE